METGISTMVMVLTGIGLAMDAFTVSISCGLSCRRMEDTLSTAIKVALSFGFFQGIMILIGWALGLSFKDFISTYDHWVAFVLLALIGGKMMCDAAEESGCPISLNSKRMLLTLSIATSIDALAIGVSFSVLNISQIAITSTAVVVGIITFLFCFSGTYMGSKIGCNPKFKAKIDMAGGLILITLGLKILVEHTIFA